MDIKVQLVEWAIIGARDGDFDEPWQERILDDFGEPLYDATSADNPADLQVGDTIKFRPSYGALVRLMLGGYIDKVVTPSPEEFSRLVEASPHSIEVPPTIDGLEEEHEG